MGDLNSLLSSKLSQVFEAGHDANLVGNGIIGLQAGMKERTVVEEVGSNEMMEDSITSYPMCVPNWPTVKDNYPLLSRC
jgi:hypothetical protein